MQQKRKNTKKIELSSYIYNGIKKEIYNKLLQYFNVDKINSDKTAYN